MTTQGDLELAGATQADVMLVLLDELEKRNVLLEQANVDLAHFAQVAAHDLRSPLTVVSAYIEQSLRHDATMNETTREWLGRALAATRQVSDLVQALLAHTTSSTEDIVAEAVDLSGVFAEVVDRLGHAIDAANARVSLAPLPRVRGDRHLLGLVAQNLIENAVKFARPEYAPAVEVSSRKVAANADLARDVYVIRVRDYGIGIPMADRERVFALFGRGTASGQPGHGIGLATCARIVQRHGGVLRIVDVEGPGTAIELELPAADS